jgi:hypothetical protein
MINMVLAPEDSPMTHSVFNFAEVSQAQPPAEVVNAEGEDEGNKEVVEVVVSEDILDTFQHVYVPEVVREPKMWF